MREYEESDGGPSPPVQRVGGILALVVLSAVVVFSLGVMVGKRVAEDETSLSEPPAALPTETLVPRTKKAEERGERKSASAAGEAGKLTFFETLSDEGGSAPALPRKAGTEPAKSAPPPPRQQEKKQSAETPPASAPTPAVSKPPPPPPKPPAAKGIGDLTGAGRYYVQVSSTTNRQWADELVKRLEKKRVPAKATSVSLKGKEWYRIRVGAFPDRAAADKAKELLKKDMDLDGMVVTVD